MEEEGKQEEKFEFTEEGEGYISLDQARVLALQYARDNKEPYGAYSNTEIVWEIVDANETDDYYDVTLSYRPTGRFRSPGIERITIDKSGPIEFRQILSQPRPARSLGMVFAFVGALVVVGGVLSGLVLTGVLDQFDSITDMSQPSSENGLPSATKISKPPSTNEPSSLGEVTHSSLEDKLAGKVVFSSNRDGNWQIYVMADDGSDETNVSNSPFNAAMPSWSPDGSKIAYTSDEDGDRDIFVMDFNGANPIRISDIPGDAENPRWAPDGNKILFNEDLDIYVVNPDGTGLSLLYSLGNGAEWSSDGTRVIFSGTQGERGIHVVNADGSDHSLLVTGPRIHMLGRWSHDDSQIVFQSERGEKTDYQTAVFVMDSDGTNQIQLTSNSSWNGDPVWSPDGNMIGYLSSPFGDNNVELMVMNKDGSGRLNLTQNSAVDAGFVWSPDSTRLAFYSKRDGNQELYSIQVDGSGLIRLTDNLGSDSLGDWTQAGVEN